MSKYSAGKECLSYCGKCKLSLAHTIVSMKDINTIGKVQCRTCGTSHAYKDPATKLAKVKKTTRTSKTRSTKSIPVNQLWTEQMAAVKSKPIPYNIRHEFNKWDLVDHKKFGAGIVQDIVDGKIEVLFQHDIKTLVHAIK